MRLDAPQSFNRLLDLGNNIKSMRISEDMAHAIVMEDIAAEWGLARASELVDPLRAAFARTIAHVKLFTMFFCRSLVASEERVKDMLVNSYLWFEE
jgi:hypothetical protein